MPSMLSKSEIRPSVFVEELRTLISAAHAIRDSKAKRLVVGHNVKVSNLWTLRDFWEWLCPGYTSPRTRNHALSNAAFASYAGIRHLRDFKMELEAGSTAENPSVGLWAKPYMTSPEYTYLGTLISRRSFESVTRKQPPPQQSRDISAQKTTREANVLKKFHALRKSNYAEQLSSERLADAIAMCERDWQHFKDSEGERQADMMMLPHELAMKMKAMDSASSSSAGPASLESDGQRSAERAVAEYHLDDDPRVVHKAVKQREHAGSDAYGFARGSHIPAAASSTRTPTDREFAARRIFPGSFVITRPAT